jgi:hypothetical protein
MIESRFSSEPYYTNYYTNAEKSPQISRLTE